MATPANAGPGPVAATTILAPFKQATATEITAVKELFAELVEKAEELEVPRDLTQNLSVNVIDGIPYIMFPVKHGNQACNNFIHWLVSQAAQKRFGLFMEGMERGQEIANLKMFNAKIFKDRPLPLDGYVFGMEDPYWACLASLENKYFDLQLKGQPTDLGNVYSVDKGLLDNITNDLILSLQGEPDNFHRIWEAFEKASSVDQVFQKIWAQCKFPNNANAGKRAEIFLKMLENLLLRVDPTTYINRLCDMFRILCKLSVDNLSILDKEKTFLKKLVFDNKDVKVAQGLFIDFHHSRRDPIMARHIVSSNLPRQVIKVIQVGYAHVEGYAPRGSKERHSLWHDIIATSRQKRTIIIPSPAAAGGAGGGATPVAEPYYV